MVNGACHEGSLELSHHRRIGPCSRPATPKCLRERKWAQITSPVKSGQRTENPSLLYLVDVTEKRVGVVESNRRPMFLKELMPYGGLVRRNTTKNPSRDERRLVEQPLDGRGGVPYSLLFFDTGGLQR